MKYYYDISKINRELLDKNTTRFHKHMLVYLDLDTIEKHGLIDKVLACQEEVNLYNYRADVIEKYRDKLKYQLKDLYNDSNHYLNVTSMYYYKYLLYTRTNIIDEHLTDDVYQPYYLLKYLLKYHPQHPLVPKFKSKIERNIEFIAAFDLWDAFPQYKNKREQQIQLIKQFILNNGIENSHNIYELQDFTGEELNEIYKDVTPNNILHYISIKQLRELYSVNPRVLCKLLYNTSYREIKGSTNINLNKYINLF